MAKKSRLRKQREKALRETRRRKNTPKKVNEMERMRDLVSDYVAFNTRDFVGKVNTAKTQAEVVDRVTKELLELTRVPERLLGSQGEGIQRDFSKY